MKDIHDPIYLFGSRANSLKKGGDVDIMIISDSLYAEHLYKSMNITIAYQSICDEKVDIIIFPSDKNQILVLKDFFEHITKIRLQ